MNTKLTYLYKLTGNLVETEAAYYPKNPYRNLGLEQVLLKNKDLFLGQYVLTETIIFITIFPAFESTFTENIIRSYHLRNKFFRKIVDFNSYLEHLFLEYLAWLSQMKLLLLGDSILKPRKKYFLTFFSRHNKLYYENKRHQNPLRRYNYALNPFIEYWFHCQELETALNLPRFTAFLPNIPILENLPIVTSHEN